MIPKQCHHQAFAHKACILIIAWYSPRDVVSDGFWSEATLAEISPCDQASSQARGIVREENEAKRLNGEIRIFGLFGSRIWKPIADRGHEVPCLFPLSNRQKSKTLELCSLAMIQI